MKNRSRHFVMLILLPLLLAVHPFAEETEKYACTSIVVSKGASVDGSVMTTHSCDGPFEMRLHVIPGRKHEPGKMRKVYIGGGRGAEKNPAVQSGEIPEAAETFSRFDIAYPFMNEKQVAIGETTIGGRRELYNPDGMMDIMTLERIALERASTAREAIQIMGELATQYGYSDGGECLTVCDTKEAWVFEIFGSTPLQIGALWAARRVPDGEVSVSANRSRIGELRLDDPDNYMASENVISLAEKMGWYDPEKDGSFRFNDVYDPISTGYYRYTRRREWRVLSLLAPQLNLNPDDGDGYPFSVKPAEKVSVQTLMTIHRDYYQGTEYDLSKGLAAGPFATPNRYNVPSGHLENGHIGWERPITYNKCSYSFVSQSRDWLPDCIGGLAWFGEDDPKTSCYVPFYCGIADVPESFKTGRKDVFDRNSAWWAFNFLGNWADLKFSYMIEDIRAVYKQIEGDFFDMQPHIEDTALQLYKEDPAKCRRFLTDYSNVMAQKVVDAWWELADHLVVKYTDGLVNKGAENIRVGYPEEWLDLVGYGEKKIKIK
jgi:dipeptidase